MIERNVEVEARLIDDLLDITRIASGKLQFHMDRVDVHEAARAALDVCAGQIRAKEHLVVVELEAGRHHVVGDAARLQQVFWNLITNAVKFTPAGGVITIDSYDDGGRLYVAVRDTGIGIDPDLLSKVFTVFEQGDVSITKRFGGLGLGLSISRAIVEALGGAIRADSEGRGMGTVFTVELPVEG